MFVLTPLHSIFWRLHAQNLHKSFVRRNFAAELKMNYKNGLMSGAALQHVWRTIFSFDLTAAKRLR